MQSAAAKLQKQLWERSSQRQAARSQGPVATAMMDLIMSDLDKKGGNVAIGALPAGAVPESIFDKANAYLQVRR